MTENNNQEENVVELRDFFKILIRRKISFFISFVVILILCIAYTFLIGPNYLSVSRLKIAKFDTVYNNTLLRFFPDESNLLLIFPTERILEMEDSGLNNILNELKYNDILEGVSGILKNKFSKENLAKSVDFRMDSNEKVIIINIYRKTPNEAYEINKAIVDYYLEKKYSEYDQLYSDLLKKLDILLVEKNNSLDELLQQARDYVISFNLDFLKELQKTGNINKDISGISYIPPNLSKSINDTVSDKNDLVEIIKLLDSNREAYTKRIAVVQSPALADVIDYSNFVRNIVLSIVISLIFAAIISFIVNYFKAPRQH